MKENVNAFFMHTFMHSTPYSLQNIAENTTEILTVDSRLSLCRCFYIIYLSVCVILLL